MALARNLRYEDAFIITLPNGSKIKIQGKRESGNQVQISIDAPKDCIIDFLNGATKNEYLEHD